MTADPAGKRVARDGVWAVVNHDGDSPNFLPVVAVFSTELPALRFAVGTSLAVVRMRYGDDYSHALPDGAE